MSDHIFPPGHPDHVCELDEAIPGVTGKVHPSEPLSPLQLTERQAVVLDRLAVLQVVSALRRYRAAAKALLHKRYRDGECDTVALTRFENECESIEQDEC